MKKIALLALSLIILYCLIEVFFRLWFPHTNYSLTYAPWGWKHQANTTTVYYGEVAKFGWGQKGVRVRYGKWGLRGYNEWKVGWKQILCLGDSWLEDMGSFQDNLITSYMDRDLLPVYHVINAGHYGFDNAQEYLWYKMEGYKYKPDIVLLFYAEDRAAGEWIRYSNNGAQFEIISKTFTWEQRLYRNIVSFVRLRSHSGNWFLNRLNRISCYKRLLQRKGFKEKDKLVMNCETQPLFDSPSDKVEKRISNPKSNETFEGTGFRLIDASIFLALDREVKKTGGVLVMVKCMGKWSEVQRNFFENCNIRYMDLDYEVIIKNRAQKEIDIKAGVYKRELDSDRFGYKNNEAVAGMIVEFLKGEGLI